MKKFFRYAVKNIPKTPQIIYLEKEYLKFLKALSYIKHTTICKTINNIIKVAIETTKNNLPDGFDIDKLAKEYDKNSKNKKSRKK